MTGEQQHRRKYNNQRDLKYFLHLVPAPSQSGRATRSETSPFLQSAGKKCNFLGTRGALAAVSSGGVWLPVRRRGWPDIL